MLPKFHRLADCKNGFAYEYVTLYHTKSWFEQISKLVGWFRVKKDQLCNFYKKLIMSLLMVTVLPKTILTYMLPIIFTYKGLIWHDGSKFCQFELPEKIARSLLRITAVNRRVNFDFSKIFIGKIQWIHSIEFEFKAVWIWLCHVHYKKLRCKRRIVRFLRICNKSQLQCKIFVSSKNFSQEILA